MMEGKIKPTECTECGKFKARRYFRKTAINGLEPLICNHCRFYDPSCNMLRKNGREYKCLKCDDIFFSVRGYRVCYQCKAGEDWKDGQND